MALSGLANHEDNVLSRLQSRFDFGEGIGIADGLAIDFEDNIAAPELDGFGEAAGLDIGHDDTLVGLQIQPFGGSVGNRLDGDSELAFLGLPAARTRRRRYLVEHRRASGGRRR